MALIANVAPILASNTFTEFRLSHNQIANNTNRVYVNLGDTGTLVTTSQNVVGAINEIYASGGTPANVLTGAIIANTIVANVSITSSNANFREIIGTSNIQMFGDGSSPVSNARITSNGHLFLDAARDGSNTGTVVINSQMDDNDTIIHGNAIVSVFHVDASTGNVGIRSNAPDRSLEVNSPSGNCARMTHNDSTGTAQNYLDFGVTSTGNGVITAAAGTVFIKNNLNANYAVSANYLYIPFGNGEGFANINLYGKAYAGTTANIAKISTPGDLRIDTAPVGNVYVNQLQNRVDFIVGGNVNPFLFSTNATTNCVSINQNVATKALEINSPTGENLRLSFNSPRGGSNANVVDFATTANAELVIAARGGLIEQSGTPAPLLISNTSIGAGQYSQLWIDGDVISFSRLDADRFVIYTMDKKISFTQQHLADLVGEFIENWQIVGNRLYISGTSKFYTYDISNLQSPTQLDSYVTDGGIMKISGQYAFIISADNDTFTALSIADPANISYLGSVGDNTTLDHPIDFDVQGRFAYVICDGATDKLTLIDISNPRAMTIVTNYTTGITLPKRIVCAGSFAYIVSTGLSNRVNVINISNPAGISTTGSFAPSGDMNSPTMMQAHDGTVITGDATNLNIYNTSQFDILRTPPKIATITYSGGEAISGYDFFGRYLVVLVYKDSATWIHVYKLSEFQTPSLRAGDVTTGNLLVKQTALIEGDFQVESSAIVAQNLLVGRDLAVSNNVTIARNARLYLDANTETYIYFDGTNLKAVVLGAAAQTIVLI